MEDFFEIITRNNVQVLFLVLYAKDVPPNNRKDKVWSFLTAHNQGSSFRNENNQTCSVEKKYYGQGRQLEEKI